MKKLPPCPPCEQEEFDPEPSNEEIADTRAFLASKRIRDINPTAFAFRGRIRKLLVGDKTALMLAEFIRCRQYLSDSNRQGLASDLTDLAKRCVSFADQLNAPAAPESSRP